MDAFASQQFLTRHPPCAVAAAWLKPDSAGARHSSQVCRVGVEGRRRRDERRVQAAGPTDALSSVAVMRFGGNLRMRAHGTATNSRRLRNGILAPKACGSSQPVSLSLKAESGAQGDVPVEAGSVSVVLLSGGVGKRMGANMPKQYLPLRGQPIALYSFLTFAGMEEVGEIVVVCDVAYESVFLDAQGSLPRSCMFKFARPGKERQDSVFSGLQEIRKSAALVAVHDSARPLVSTAETRKVLADAMQHGAAVLGVPCKATVKESDGKGFVARTLDRSLLWEMQTPQVIRPQLLRDGFSLVQEKGLEVTDDVSIVEHLGHPVKITQGFYTNIKVTTPDDMLVAEKLLASEEASAKAPLSASAA